MSKRHSEIIKPSSDLVFYAPLTNGDLTDHVSGTVATQDNNTTIEWDSDKGMYYLTSDPGNTNSQHLKEYYLSPLAWRSLTQVPMTGDFTMVITARCKYSSHKYSAFMITPDWHAIGKFVCATSLAPVRGSKQATDTTEHRLAVVSTDNGLSAPHRAYYCDGVYVTTITESYSTISTEIDHATVAICMANDERYFQMWARDARIYNRALTPAEIQNL